jgi:hypothetical protein
MGNTRQGKKGLPARDQYQVKTELIGGRITMLRGANGEISGNSKE